MPALMLKRSSRVMPGFLGTPAGMTTRSQSYKASPSLSAPVALLTCNDFPGPVRQHAGSEIQMMDSLLET